MDLEGRRERLKRGSNIKPNGMVTSQRLRGKKREEAVSG